MGVASCVRVVARVRRACSSRAFVARVRRARYVARVTSRACVARACSSRVFVACVRRAWRAGARRCGEAEAVCVCVCVCLLVNAQKHITSREILLWMTPSEAPKALQASACNELLGPTGASCWIFAQH